MPIVDGQQDQKGHFLPGNTLGLPKGEPIPHPFYPDRTVQGHRMRKELWQTPAGDLDRFRHLLCALVTDNDVQLVKKTITKLLKHKDPKIQLAALHIAYQYFMNKETNKLEVMKANVNLSAEEAREILKQNSLE